MRESVCERVRERVCEAEREAGGEGCTNQCRKRLLRLQQRCEGCGFLRFWVYDERVGVVIGNSGVSNLPHPWWKLAGPSSAVRVEVGF